MNRLTPIEPALLLPAIAAGCIFFAAAETRGGDSSRFDAAADYLAKASIVYRGDRNPGDAFAKDRAAALKRRDPETSFESFIYGIDRRKSKLLSPEQIVAWDAMMAEHTPVKTRLHDERNSIRAQELAGEWELAGAEGETVLRKITEKLDAWLDLHLAYVFQEEIAHQRFRRSAWRILTEDQQKKILSGEWDSHVNKSIGHLRKYSADKIVRRALGKPDRPDEFNALVEKQSAAHQPIHEAYTGAKTRQRKLNFAMDLNSEAMLVVEWPVYEEAFREFLLAQRRDIQALCRAGYDFSEPVRRKAIEKARAEVHAKTRDKYAENAAELLRILYPGE